MTQQWTDLGPVESFALDTPKIVKKAGRRLVVVRASGAPAPHVLDDRCPHQGYPLSQGTFRDGLLTCAWHNWKFDVCSGSCTTGGDDVRRFPSELRDGHLHADLHVDPAGEVERLTKGLQQALADDEQGAAVRAALRLTAVTGTSDLAFATMARDAATRAPWGFHHASATLADIVAWVDVGSLTAAEGFAIAACMIGEMLARQPQRAVPEPPEGDVAADTIHRALRDEQVAEAEACVRALVARGATQEALRGVLAYLSDDLIAYGHGAIYASKARELSTRFAKLPDGLSRAVEAESFAAAAVAAGWGTRETSLPPYRTTREALGRVGAIRVGSEEAADDAVYVAAVLEGEASAVDATVEALEGGVAPKKLVRLAARAAARRLRAFDLAWLPRDDAEVGFLDVTHCVTFSEALLSLWDAVDEGQQARFAVQAAAFVGKVQRGDDAGAEASASGATQASERIGSLDEALARRSEGGALTALEEVAVDEAFERLRRFAAIGAATRPIFIAHTIKTHEALRRLAAGDPEHDRLYLEAAIHFLVPARRERRFTRVATIAEKFIADGRPPAGLY